MVRLHTSITHIFLRAVFKFVLIRPLGGKRLSFIQMVLLTHLKAGFEKRATCRCDCDGYRPDTLGGGIGCVKSDWARLMNHCPSLDGWVTEITATSVLSGNVTPSDYQRTVSMWVVMSEQMRDQRPLHWPMKN